MATLENFRHWHHRRPQTLALLAGLCFSLGALITPVPAAFAAPLSHDSPLYNPAAPIVDENPEVSAEYKGTMTELWEYPAVANSRETIHRTATLEWAEGVSGPVDEIEYTQIYGPRAIHWHLSKLSGSVQENSTGPSGEPITCSGSFTPTSSDGGEGGVSIPLDEPGAPAGGGDPSTNPDYSLRPPLGLPSSLLSSSGSGDCATSNWNSNGNSGWGAAATFGADEAVNAQWGDTAGPTVYFPPGSSHSQPLNFSYVCQPPSCGPEHAGVDTYGKISLTVTSSITFSSPGLPSATGKGPVTKKTSPGTGGGGSPPGSCGTGSKPSCQDKKAAQADLRSQLTPMAVHCGIAALSVSLLVAGVIAPETGAGSVLAVAGPTGAMLFAEAGTICGSLIKRAYDDAKIVNDPPAGSINKLATAPKMRGPAVNLPSCAGYALGVQGYCTSLRSDELRYTSAIRRSVAVDGALLTTVDRITAASHAHNQGAVRMQVHQGVILRSQLASAHAEQRGAGSAMAKLIKSAGLQVDLDGAEEQGGITRSFSGLSKLGLSGAQAQRLSGQTLTAGPTDFLQQLSR